MENLEKLRELTKKLEQKENIIETIIEHIPSFAMIIDKNKKVLFANRKAVELGAVVGDYCWKTFGHMDFISIEDKQYMLTHKNNKSNGISKNIHCYFCKADDCLKDQEYKRVSDILVFDKIWETYWIPINGELFIHYANDITHLLTKKQIEKIKNNVKKQMEKINNEKNI